MVDEGPARPAAGRTVQIDSDPVCVNHWRFAPDAATGWHRHEFDCVEIELKDVGSD
jgi:hypothetical protein